MIVPIRVARVGLLLMVAPTVISCVAGIVGTQTGPLEKVTLGAVIAALVVLAAGVTTVAQRAEARVRTRSAHDVPAG